MTIKELNARIEERNLKTREGLIVRKIEECRSISGDVLLEVYVEGIPWCLATVSLANGLLENNSENPEDLIY